jgi:hypothetical protein
VVIPSYPPSIHSDGPLLSRGKGMIDSMRFTFHDPSVDYTADNTYVGLAGHYLVRDCESDLELNYLPKPKYTLPLMYKVRRPRWLAFGRFNRSQEK